MSERQNIAPMIRVLSVFLLVPSLTIGSVILLFAREGHELHGYSMTILSIVGVLALVLAPRIAARFVPDAA